MCFVAEVWPALPQSLLCTCCPQPRPFLLRPPTWQAPFLLPWEGLSHSPPAWEAPWKAREGTREPDSQPRAWTPAQHSLLGPGRPPGPSLPCHPTFHSLLGPLASTPSRLPAVSPCWVFSSPHPTPSRCDASAPTSRSDPVATFCPPTSSRGLSPSHESLWGGPLPCCSGSPCAPHRGTGRPGSFHREHAVPSSVHAPESSRQPPRGPGQGVRARLWCRHVQRAWGRCPVPVRRVAVSALICVP